MAGVVKFQVENLPRQEMRWVAGVKQRVDTKTKATGGGMQEGGIKQKDTGKRLRQVWRTGLE